MSVTITLSNEDFRRIAEDFLLNDRYGLNPGDKVNIKE